jgi:hypothetical protein
MKTKLFAVCAIAGLIASPALAQVNPATPSTSKTPPASTDMSMPSSTSSSTTSPTTPAPPAADTGKATNTAATATDLKVGAAVTDSAGADLGTIAKVAKGKDGDTMVTLKAGGKSKTIPASSLSLSGGSLVSSQTKADVWGPK